MSNENLVDQGKKNINIYAISTTILSTKGEIQILANETNISIISMNLFIENNRKNVSKILSILKFSLVSKQTMLYPVIDTFGLYHNCSGGSFIGFWPKDSQYTSDVPWFSGLEIFELITFFESLLQRLDFKDTYKELKLRPYINYGSTEDVLGVPDEPVLVPEEEKIEQVVEKIDDLSGIDLEDLILDEQ